MNTQNYTEQEWQALHEKIQQRFQALAIEVERLAPAVYAEFGKTVTSRFPLFSHVSFNVAPENTRSDVIVGVDIGPEDGQWRIDADVCDEEDGTIYFELPNMPFSASSVQELTDRVLRTTDELVAGAKPVLLRLLGASVAPLSGANMPLADTARRTPV
jgi:hypothetical protein